MQKRKLHISTNDNEEMESPILSGLKKENSFGVPRGYFDELPQRISDSVDAAKSKRRHMPYFGFFWQHRWATIPGLAVIVLILFFWLQPDNGNIQTTEIITLEEIFIEKPEWIENMTDDELLETLYAISDNEMEFDDDLLNFDSISTDVLNTALDNEVITYDLLYNF